MSNVLNPIYRTKHIDSIKLIAPKSLKERITWLVAFLLHTMEEMEIEKTNWNIASKKPYTRKRQNVFLFLLLIVSHGERESTVPFWSGAITKATVPFVTMKRNCFIVHAFCRRRIFTKCECFHSLISNQLVSFIINFKRFQFDTFFTLCL